QKREFGLLLLATIRSEGLVPDHRIQRWQRELASTVPVDYVTLSPLDAASTATLASHVIGQMLIPAEPEALFRATEGNPLFTVEMARAGLEGSASQLPRRIRSVVELRLSQLTPRARELLKLAALIGCRFTFPLLAAASPQSDYEIVDDLDELLRWQIIHEAGNEDYDFGHDVIRQVTLAQLSAARRRWGHQRIAEALENLFTPDLDPVRGEIAAHWAGAGEKDKAARHYMEAAAKRDAAMWTVWLDLHLLRALYFGNAEIEEMNRVSEAIAEPLQTYGTAQQRAYYFAALGWARNRVLRYDLTDVDFCEAKRAKVGAADRRRASHCLPSLWTGIHAAVGWRGVAVVIPT
ncbi:MAG TPA: hypothetical protein VE553_09870, partial [Candidatus Binatia bacterium]|nr:hypothetical protein [Candidatus Binatia bacterium]